VSTRILLVEDNSELLEMWGDCLEEWIRDVEIDTALDGDDAFRLYCRRGAYDLVLTDDIHSGLSGIEFAKAIRREHANQRIAFLTVEKDVEEPLWQQFMIPSLRKPFALRELEKLLHEVLGGGVFRGGRGIVKPASSPAAIGAVAQYSPVLGRQPKDVHRIFLVIAVGILIVGTLLAGMGIFLVRLGSHGDTSIRFFGQSFNSSSVGIGAIFIGATTIVVVLTKLMKRLQV